MNSSYHIFLFPFKWQLNQPENKKGVSLFSDLTNLEKANELVLQDRERWNIDLYTQFKDHEDYNEFIYFYPFVRSVLYDYRDEPNRNTLIRHYSFTPAAGKGLKYIINVKNKKSYRLGVEFILLNLYKTGVGLLSFHLKNEEADQQEWDDILSINEYGRRLYPQFLSDGFSTEYTRNNFLADSIEIVNEGTLPVEGLPVKDDFEFQTGISSIKKGVQPHKIDVVPNHIDKILPKQFRAAICIEPVIDDRMYVVCTYFDKDNVFSQRVKDLKVDESGRLTSDFNAELYKYIFVDGPSSGGVGNDAFRDDLLKEHTYHRWIGEATFFGVSRYSFVSYSNYFPVPVHTRTMYYKMAELCLIQRASVLTFTEEVSRISRLDENTKLLTGKLNDLYKNYIQFVNKIYFREVTAQEQGIELYEMMQKKMRLRDEVASLDAEIEELHNYVMLLEEKERSKQLEVLTLIGGALIIPSLVIGYFGMNQTYLMPMSSLGRFLFLVLLFLLSALPLVIVERKWVKGGKSVAGLSAKSWLLLLLFLAIILLLLIFTSKSNT